jgi:hypothetical protein
MTHASPTVEYALASKANVAACTDHHYRLAETTVVLAPRPRDLYCLSFFILKILHEGHTPAAKAASTEGQQQDTAITL